MDIQTTPPLRQPAKGRLPRSDLFGIFDLARMIQRETGAGFPFSCADPKIMEDAVRAEIRKMDRELREHRKREEMLRNFLATFPKDRAFEHVNSPLQEGRSGGLHGASC